MSAPAILPSIRPRLAQLVRLLLSSTAAGEIVAAQTAINKTLKAAGVDLHTFAAEIEHPQKLPAPHPEPGQHQEPWRHKVKFCLDHAQWLNTWERGFVADM